MHEGIVEASMSSKLNYIPPLFLENLEAYFNPEKAQDIIIARRCYIIEEIFNAFPWIERICDVAFYYAPFITALKKVFPDCRLVIIIRDGRFYVRSSTTSQVPDPQPVGYGPADEFTCQSHPVLFKGRLRPKKLTPIDIMWSSFSSFQKNAWVWAETNRIIFEQLNNLPEENYKIFRFEDLFIHRKVESFKSLLRYIGYEDISITDLEEILLQKINKREMKTLLHPTEWNKQMKDQFDEICGEMMNKLGYLY